MKSTVEQLNPTRVKITVEVPFAELEPDFAKAYKSLAGQVNIPGFRPGKAPAKLLESRIGRPAVLEQVINDMIPSRYSQAVDEHELVVLAQPEIEVTKLEDNDVVEFTAEVDIRPEITLPTFEDLEVTVEAPETDEAAVDAELDNLRARFGTLKGVERGATTGDFLSVDLAATVDGEPVDEASTEGLSYELGSGTLVEGLDDAAAGLKAGESKEFTSSLVAGDHAGKEAVITVTVQSVKERELPEADDEFAQMASEFDTLDELKADLTEKVAQQAKAGLAGEIRDKVLDALMEATDVPTPEAVVESEAHAQMHQLIDQFGGDASILDQALAAEGTDRETFEAETREGAARAIRSQLLLDAVAEQNSTDVSQEELTQHILFQAQRYGMDPNQFVQQIQQAGQLGSLFSDVRRSKALADVIGKVTVKDTEGNVVDTSEFFGTVEADSADSADDAEATASDADETAADEKDSDA
ncbi:MULTISPECIES: trigger factor [Dietzia]|uniref:Trigger factor n=1 Tax=Dietzia maris TaxID=37915 RepID=A0ABT8GYU6_9ACTN|nr:MULTISPECIES: trigger factor [Dietzia]MBB0997328.1 trigger factor [Dietzia maris]MCZ4655626.1 trigger factor [Dietzia kunjamensis]MDJ0422086.1 trigger factor [Dietzia kunjamensis]MDN4505390.1 trigger factor [Dietzia maris]MDV3356049.1 trigger factor [Dietzia sp. IN118]